MIKKTNFRIVASILVIALLLMCMSTMLIACDKNSNNNRNNNNNSDDVILTANKDIDGFLDNALGYVMSKNKKIYTIGIFNLLSSELESWMAGGTVLGFMFVGTNNSLDNTEENLTIYHFESAALASSSYFALTDTDEYEEFHISLLDNIIIMENKSGAYKTFRNSHTPTNSISTKVTDFIKNAILSECTPQKGVFAYLGFRQQSFLNFDLISNSNNITISYSINSEKIEYPVIDIKDYTDDSYRNKFDDGYYFSYLKKVTDDKANSEEETN